MAKKIISNRTTNKEINQILDGIKKEPINISVVRTNCSDYVYIGRPSPLGNPFPMRDEKDRDKVVEQYYEYFHQCLESPTPQFAAAIDHLLEMAIVTKSINLACYCAPRACHGDVIKSYLTFRLRDLGHDVNE